MFVEADILIIDTGQMAQVDSFQDLTHSISVKVVLVSVSEM